MPEKRRFRVCGGGVGVGGSVWLGRGHSRMHVKEWRTRRWRHMDTCQFKTILEAAVPVYQSLASNILPIHKATIDRTPPAEPAIAVIPICRC